MSKQAKRGVKSKTDQGASISHGSRKKAAAASAPPLDQPDKESDASSMSKTRPAALWCDTSVELLLRLRFREMDQRFTSAKSTQMKNDAYAMLAAELSTAMQREYDHNQVQKKLHQLRKMWFHPKYRATGNGRNVRSKPQYFDIMFEYWGSKLGYSQETLLSSDQPNEMSPSQK
ncbi:hypothetical protein AC1031_020572 [Aphanomyces cochlioides]|nr:hypothetical protein AC1031_020572 [Aphanomyces cochlioides]